MYYKVIENTPTWHKLTEISNQIMQANNQAAALAKELGADHYCREQRSIGGGIDALQFSSPPEGYKKVGQSWEKWYFPKAVNKDVLKLISELPKVDSKELNETLSFTSPQVVSSDQGGLMMVSTPRILWNDKYVIFELPRG